MIARVKLTGQSSDNTGAGRVIDIMGPGSVYRYGIGYLQQTSNEVGNHLAACRLRRPDILSVTKPTWMQLPVCL